MTRPNPGTSPKLLLLVFFLVLVTDGSSPMAHGANDPPTARPAEGLKVTSDASALHLTSPLDYQVFQRQGRDYGSVLVTGSLTAEAESGGVLEARFLDPRVPSDWQSLLALSPGQVRFRTVFTAPAGGWYALEVRTSRNGRILATARVAHVGVGEIFVIAGQSNSANHGEEKQMLKSDRVTALAEGQWQIAHDPQPGASGREGSFMPPFAEALADSFRVPIGLVAVGAGGTSVREWLPRGTRFSNPPTVTNLVTPLPSGEWECKGVLFDKLVGRMKGLGPHGFRAILWHQGESDANQQDATRTLPGNLYRNFLQQLIRESNRAAGWNAPWFVAQTSYHSPEDPASPDLRQAQAALWKSGTALEGPDTDALTGPWRDLGGRGVHFNGAGLREHARLWVEKVKPWLAGQLAEAAPALGSIPTRVSGPTPRLILPGTDLFTLEDTPAFVFSPAPSNRVNPQPWILYAPTLPAYPDEAERWMHERFLSAGIAVAGIDVGEAYGSPRSHPKFEALYRHLVEEEGFAGRPCLLGRSRGGLWVASWAISNPDRVAGIAGIYPVFDFRTYPGLTNAAPAFGLTPAELATRAPDLNPVARLPVLARARIPAFLIHGDQDTVVPLDQNSAEFARCYREGGAESWVKLVVLKGQGHNYDEGFFRCQELVDFAVARARAGAQSAR